MVKCVLTVALLWQLLGDLWAAEQVSRMRQPYDKMVSAPVARRHIP